MTNLLTKMDIDNEEQVLIYKDREIEEKKLIQTLNDLNQIQTNLTDLLLQQDEKVDRIEDNINLSEMRIKKALEDLAECDKLHFSYKPILAGTIIGGAICSPLVTLIGVKYIGISTSVGGFLGGFAGYKFQK